MAAKKSNQYEVVTRLRHDGEIKESGEVVEIKDDFTAKTLVSRGIIKPAGSKVEVTEPTAGQPDPGMTPAAIKENDPGSAKVEV